MIRKTRQDPEPNYVQLDASGELEKRVQRVLAGLEKCRVCPWDCEINRLKDEKKVCQIGRFARVSSYFPHFGEEDCLRGHRGSGTIFLAGAICAVSFVRILISAKMRPAPEMKSLQSA